MIISIPIEFNISTSIYKTIHGISRSFNATPQHVFSGAADSRQRGSWVLARGGGATADPGVFFSRVTLHLGGITKINDYHSIFGGKQSLRWSEANFGPHL